MFDFKFNWDPQLEIGINELDQQHQQLFKIGRCIEQHLIVHCAGATDEGLMAILYELRDYITYHFFTEEEYMEEIGYPDLETHKIQHKRFKDDINKIDYEQLCAEPQSSLINLRDYLVSWIFEHMVHEDQKIAQYINTKN